MPPPTRSFLSSFLQSRRAHLLASISSPAPPRIVFGNESGDLDTFASSILYAALAPARPAPLFPIPRADLALRPELLHVLRTLRVAPGDVLCADDEPPLDALARAEVHLVDHNRLALAAPRFAPERVRGVVDHHHDEGLYAGAAPRLVTPAGSCASLVVEQWFAAAELPPGAKRELATLALAAILVDTANLTLKVTAHDEAAVALLKDALGAGALEEGAEGWDRDAFYAGVFEAKKNVEGMRLRDLLRKDYKEWTEAGRRLGIASVVKEMSWMRSREEGAFLQGLRKWGEERELDVLSVMTTDGQGDHFQRELLVWALTERGRDAVKAFEECAEGEGLQLERWQGGELDEADGSRRAWKQGNLAMSRKQVAPLLRQCLRAGTVESKV